MLTYMTAKYQALPLAPRLLKKSLRTYLHKHLQFCQDATFAQQFPYQQLDLPASYFQQQIIEVAGRQFLTGPRYIGGDINQPFIDLVAQSGPLTPQSMAAIFHHWEKLQASRLRVLGLPGEHPDSAIDQWIYGCHMTQSPNINKTRSSLRLTNCLPTDFDWCMQALRSSYAALYRRLPLLENEIVSSQPEELQEEIASGSVWRIDYRGQKAGLIICVPAILAFMRGHIIYDEVILPQFQGQRLAARAQQKLQHLLSLKRNPHNLLLGTISPNNQPSLKTAAHAGRQPWLSYNFLSRSE